MPSAWRRRLRRWNNPARGGSCVFCGFGGDDSITSFTLDTRDIFLGGEGDDVVDDNRGTFYGGEGNDVVHSNFGTFYGGPGNDVVEGSNFGFVDLGPQP